MVATAHTATSRTARYRRDSLGSIWPAVPLWALIASEGPTGGRDEADYSRRCTTGEARLRVTPSTAWIAWTTS